jgi:hypothetical protein
MHWKGTCPICAASSFWTVLIITFRRAMDLFEADVLAGRNRFLHAIESKQSHRRSLYESQQGHVPSGVQRLAKELGVRKA